MKILLQYLFLPLGLVLSSSQSWDLQLESKEGNHRRLHTVELDETSIAEQNCLEDAHMNEENLASIGLECKCEVTSGGVTLICIDDCAYCNEFRTVCGVRSPQAFYDGKTGKRTAIGGVFQYYLGFYGTLSVQNVGCVENEDGRIVGCETCNVFANDEMCNSCEFQTCEDGRREEIMDCSNIEGGATFDFCQDVKVDQGIFQAFSTAEYEECLPVSLLKSSKKSSKGKSSKRSKTMYSKSAKKAQSRMRRL